MRVPCARRHSMLAGIVIHTWPVLYIFLADHNHFAIYIIYNVVWCRKDGCKTSEINMPQTMLSSNYDV